MRSRWANSIARRPRLSQTPERICSISASDFSGKAIRKFSRPILCSLSFGPTLRISPAAKSDILCGSVQRSILMVPTATLPSTASRKALGTRMRIGSAASERDDDLAEHLPGLEPFEPALELLKRHFHVDHGLHAGGHLVE